MGWTGYGIYDGDETKTRHINFLQWAGWKDDDSLEEVVLNNRKTKLTPPMKECLNKGLDKVLKKMPKLSNKKLGDSFFVEEWAIEWQMLLALFLDSKLSPPKVVLENGIAGTEILMKDHADGFDYPGLRKARLRAFIRKARAI